MVSAWGWGLGTLWLLCAPRSLPWVLALWQHQLVCQRFPGESGCTACCAFVFFTELMFYPGPFFTLVCVSTAAGSLFKLSQSQFVVKPALPLWHHIAAGPLFSPNVAQSLCLASNPPMVWCLG